ncbi:LysM peptidoglycan-binding domain-containing protein [bacterium]|nr:LysM peptidoglycan-binding domain-containing protein [bacterium]
MYRDARFAFFVILALMVLVVIIWGRSPTPEDIILDQPGPDATVAAGRAVPPPPAGTARAAVGASAPLRAGAVQPRGAAVPGSTDRPSFEWGDTATVVHVPPPPVPPPVALSGGRAAATSVAAARRPAAPAPSAAVKPPPLATHVVVKGDTYSSIARKHYGKATLWRHIHAANKDVPPEKLFVDTKLVIPALPGVPAPTAAAKATPKAPSTPATTAKPTAKPPTATADRPTSPTTSSGTSYVVKKGDTFYQIALRVYKNGSLWPKLYEHNRSRLRNPKDPGSLQADQRILIPMIGS